MRLTSPEGRTRRPVTASDAVLAEGIAAILSGAPSTIYALARGPCRGRFAGSTLKSYFDS